MTTTAMTNSQGWRSVALGRGILRIDRRGHSTRHAAAARTCFGADWLATSPASVARIWSATFEGNGVATMVPDGAEVNPPSQRNHPGAVCKRRVRGGDEPTITKTSVPVD
jgi:hypothetical protein